MGALAAEIARADLAARLLGETEVLQLLAEGLSNPEIATRLVLSRRTVDAHLRSIFDKLGVSTRTAAALKAKELAIGPPKS